MPGEALDVMLGFHQYQMSRSIVFLPTEVKSKQRYLKPQGEISGLPKQSNDIYMEIRFETYLQRPTELQLISLNRNLVNRNFRKWVGLHP